MIQKYCYQCRRYRKNRSLHYIAGSWMTSSRIVIISPSCDNRPTCNQNWSLVFRITDWYASLFSNSFDMVNFSFYSSILTWLSETCWIVPYTSEPLLCIQLHHYLKSSPSYYMMTSSNGNIFRVTGHLCGEFTGPRWSPHTKASD